MAYRIHQREETFSKVLAVAPDRGQGEKSNSFIPMDPISRGSSQHSGQSSSQGFNPKPRLPHSLGGEGGQRWFKVVVLTITISHQNRNGKRIQIIGMIINMIPVSGRRKRKRNQKLVQYQKKYKTKLVSMNSLIVVT